MSRKDTVGTTYLICFDQKYKHAAHYVGWAVDLDRRIADHKDSKGSRLLAVINDAGIGWHVARTWPGTTRAFERHLKDTRHVPFYCPAHQAERNAARREARREMKEQQMNKNTEPQAEREQVTVGELAKGVAAGTWTKEQAAKAISKLEVIHWSAEVDRPAPEIDEREMGA